MPPVALAVALMLFVVDVPDHPFGSVHVYVVAPFTAVTEYVLVEFAHTVPLPLIAPGVAGVADTVIASVCAVELPQPLFAVTDMLPLVVLAVVVILFVVDVPDHPLGSVQVYDVAPLTADTEYVF